VVPVGIYSGGNHLANEDPEIPAGHEARPLRR
jgi:hypothetical protein